MSFIRELILDYNIEIIIALIGLGIVLFLTNIILSIRLSTIKKKFNLFTKDIKAENVEELLIKTGEELHDIRIDMNIRDQTIESLETKLAFAIQKVGFVRYNAFGELGSDLSYSIAFLDKFNNGLVLTSIFGRETSTNYAKPIRFGKSTYPLSVEEIQAIDRAMMGESTEKSV